MDYELAIIGAGPAGYSAGIYAIRAGIKTVIFDKNSGGGLAILSPNIENYPGFRSISGTDLMDKMKQHASKYININFNEEVTQIKKDNEYYTIITNKTTYDVKAILLCTGTNHKKLGVPGEKEFQGKGVSYCATCDGFFFKDKKVAVIGGGNSALIEAIYLNQVGCKKIYLIHRRDKLRAETAYEDEAVKRQIKLILNKTIEKINGVDKVENIEIIDVKNGRKSKLDIDGVFISIGEIPVNNLAKKLKIKLDKKGFIITDSQKRTNIKGIYAAGDITGGLRQIITACAEGAVAALATTEVLGKKYPY